MGIARCGRASACVHAFASSVRSLLRLAVAEQANTALHSRIQEEAAVSPSPPPGARAACLSAACPSHCHHALSPVPPVQPLSFAVYVGDTFTGPV
ncbi:hypothetical protein ECG_00615 [Echinococcus granulosus]|uniref:Uncharacterized protein n=1 Tax=Echinococcus granulosus TaxID=6210 RepID=A0A068W920_ECHGR|nr:hypothetical protein ECG_00615 [Echinococcus granulosus]CDS16533.1 hypothetical protein EgrG_002019900 [Echinococcus granulosus]